MTHMELTRRGFVIAAAAAGGGMILGIATPSARAAAVNPQSWMAPTDKDGVEINIWLSIDPEGHVTVRAVSQEMGQGIFTAQPMMLNEELQADWQMIRVMHADTHRHVMNDNLYSQGNHPYFGVFGIFWTEASGSIIGSRIPYQQAGASARERLKAAAAQAWGVDRSQVSAKDSVLTSGSRSANYGEFATQAAAIQLPEEPAIKTPDQYTLMGSSVARLDVPLKINGSAVFAIDARMPGMVYAAVQVSPVPEGTLRSFDFDAVKDRPGVIQAVELVPNPEAGPDDHSRLHSGVAVVADSWYRAKTALDLMPKEWDAGPGGGATTESMFASRRALLNESGTGLDDNDPAALGMIANSSRVITADYERPYIPHAVMEPINAAISVTDSRVDVFVSTQAPPVSMKVAADQLGVELDRIYLHPTFLGGGFGRRSKGDDVRQVAEIARQVGRPVKLVWTREEDIMHNPMRSMAVARLTASLGADGMPEALFTHNVSEELYATRGVGIGPYDIPGQHHEYHVVESHIPTTYLRDVWSGLYGFMTESFIDEMALAGGHDPLDFRIGLTRDVPRWQTALTTLKAKSGYTTDLPRGEGMGIGIHENHGTIVAHAATVTVSRRGQLRVEQVVSVFDPGHVVNPLTCVEQIESGISFELSHTIRGGMEIRNGQIASNNFDTFQITRISDMPQVDINIALSGGDRWGGIGEVGAGPIAPAVANAIYFATGKRVRTTPLTNHDLSWS
jgi:isoquinoline 1-oxidoreductase beta subunit